METFGARRFAVSGFFALPRVPNNPKSSPYVPKSFAATPSSPASRASRTAGHHPAHSVRRRRYRPAEHHQRGNAGVLPPARQRRRHRWRIAIFALLNPVYLVHHAEGAWRAAWQMVTSPRKWEKTPHGSGRGIQRRRPVVRVNTHLPVLDSPRSLHQVSDVPKINRFKQAECAFTRALNLGGYGKKLASCVNLEV
ncbi:hypothetical protein QFZ57_001927 [Arthrobacter sp. B1I2]|nr:hypothetical protein [Arthrobacter sp. B1I2]